MNKQFLLKLAFKNLLAHPMRSVLTLAGIIIGVSAIVFLVAFAFGIERLVTNEVTGGDAFKLIDVGTGNSQIVSVNQKAVGSIRGLSGTKSVEAVINAGAKAKNDKKAQMDVALYGTDAAYLDWLGIHTRWGNIYGNQANGNQIVVNSSYINFIGGSNVADPEKYIGSKQKFDVIVPKELTSDNITIENKDKEYTIVGIIQNESSPSVYIYIDDLVAMGAVKYSQVKVEVTGQNQVPALRKQIENLGLKTQYVGDTVSQITQIFNIFKVILGGFGLIALIVASIGMFNTLTISLLERTKEVALMKILGMKKYDIRNIFLTEAVIFGVVGGVAGILLGTVFSKIANGILNYFALRSGGTAVSVFYYPLWFLLTMIVFSLIIGLVTGIYPARRATKLDALDVLRYE